MLDLLTLFTILNSTRFPSVYLIMLYSTSELENDFRCLHLFLNVPPKSYPHHLKPYRSRCKSCCHLQMVEHNLYGLEYLAFVCHISGKSTLYSAWCPTYARSRAVQLSFKCSLSVIWTMLPAVTCECFNIFLICPCILNILKRF